VAKFQYSHDMVAVCVHLAVGDLSLLASQVAERGKAYEEQHSGCFGSSRGDLNGMLFWARYQGTELSLGQAYEEARTVSLLTVLGDMIGFEGVYANDEGETWDAVGCDNGQEPREEERLKVAGLIARWAEHDPVPEAVLAQLSEVGLDRSVLDRCAGVSRRNSTSQQSEDEPDSGATWP